MAPDDSARPNDALHRERDPPTDARRGESSTVLNALVGAVVGAVLYFVPLSPLLGGATTAYLEGGTRTDGATVGALAGVFMRSPTRRPRRLRRTPPDRRARR